MTRRRSWPARLLRRGGCASAPTTDQGATAAMPRGPSTRRTRLLAGLAVTAAAALSPAAPALAQGSDDAQVRVSPNWELRPDANPIHGRDGVGLAVDPRNADHLVALYADWASLWCETAVSFNGGRTWRRDRLEAPAGFARPTCTVGPHLANQVDGGIAFGRGGNVYATFGAPAADAGGEAGTPHTVFVARSTNGGRSFGRAVVALRGGTEAEPGPYYEFPELAVEPGRRSGRDRVYLIAESAVTSAQGAEQEDVVLSVSSNSGRTWSTPRAIDAQGNSIEASRPVLGRRGTLLVAWRTRGAGPNGAPIPEGTVVLARSGDRGRTWRETRVAGVRGYVYEGPRVAPFATGPPFFTASTFPRIAADPRSGNVYLVYGNGGPPTVPGEARAADHFIHPDIDAWFQRSTDGGATWSRPSRLNDELRVSTEISQTRHPSVSVAPEGRVDIVWHDRRHWYRGCPHTHTPCLEARLGDTYYSFSDDAGRSFSADRRLTDRSINNDVGYDYRFGTYWFYPPVAVPLDERRLLVAWMDSRNGNVQTDTQGIYLTRVTHGASGRLRREAVRAGRRSALSVELSRRAYPAGPEAVLGGTFATRPWTRVVIVNQRDEAAALAGGVLARANIGTVLVSAADGLSDEVKAELARLQPIGAYVVGSERQLSAQVVEDLAATGIPSEQIERLSGLGEADTARLIAEEVDRRTPEERASGAPAFDAAILVNPDSDDAYAASVLAATRRLPILFARRGSLSAATRQALASLALRRVLVVGGERVLSARVLRGLPGAKRLGGSTALRTSLAVLRESRRRGVAENIVYAAGGRMESALLGPAAARIGGLQLMAGADRAASVLADRRLSSRVDRLVQVTGGDGE